MQTINLQSTPISGTAYLRCAASQLPEASALEAQRQRIEARAAQDGVVLVRFYTDMFQPAFQQGPGMAELLADAKKGDFGILYVDTFDRIDRRLKRMAQVVDQLRQAGVSLVGVQQSFDLRNPLMLAAFLACVSPNFQFERLPYRRSRKPARK